jgi:hypothetical protein
LLKPQSRITIDRRNRCSTTVLFASTQCQRVKSFQSTFLWHNAHLYFLSLSYFIYWHSIPRNIENMIYWEGDNHKYFKKCHAERYYNVTWQFLYVAGAAYLIHTRNILWTDSVLLMMWPDKTCFNLVVHCIEGKKNGWI